jgi:hypothetical protein
VLTVSVKKQISIVQENRVGELSRICSLLAERNVNILAFCIQDIHDFGVLRLVVDNDSRATEALEASKLSFTVTDVVAVEVPHEPGALAKSGRKLADAGINIDYGYASGSKDKSLLILKCSDVAKADSTLS